MSLAGCHVIGSHGRASLTGCHWPGDRAVLATKGYIYYIVKKNLALALWSPSQGPGGLKEPLQ